MNTSSQIYGKRYLFILSVGAEEEQQRPRGFVLQHTTDRCVYIGTFPNQPCTKPAEVTITRCNCECGVASMIGNIDSVCTQQVCVFEHLVHAIGAVCTLIVECSCVEQGPRVEDDIRLFLELHRCVSFD